jgi:hypothetical protein
MKEAAVAMALCHQLASGMPSLCREQVPDSHHIHSHGSDPGSARPWLLPDLMSCPFTLFSNMTSYYIPSPPLADFRYLGPDKAPTLRTQIVLP